MATTRAFAKIHIDLWASKLLSIAEKTILVTLKTFCNSNNTCFPSVKAIAERANCCTRKVRYVLKSLKDKSIIKIENRFRKDGSQTSNYYTIYDFEELWKAKDINEAKELIKNFENKTLDDKSLEEIYIKKEVNNSFMKKKNQPQNIKYESNVHNYNNTTNNKSQEKNEKYSLDFLKNLYDYNMVFNINPKLSENDINYILDIIYDTVNSQKHNININGSATPIDIIISRLLKLNCDDIIYVIEKYNEQTTKIHNPRAYILTVLYNAKQQYYFDIQNQINYDYANTDWTEYWNNKK